MHYWLTKFRNQPVVTRPWRAEQRPLSILTQSLRSPLTSPPSPQYLMVRRKWTSCLVVLEPSEWLVDHLRL